jgi:hypothetical protein
MTSVYVSPYNSVEIFKVPKCKRATDFHWGTWVLTEENAIEPPELLKALDRSGFAETSISIICAIGESREF